LTLLSSVREITQIIKC